MRISRASFSLAGLALFLTSGATSTALRAGPGSSGSVQVQLRNVAEAAGINFVYQHSPTSDKQYVESAPGGLAVFDLASGVATLTAKSSGWCAVLADVDNDGWKDIFTANSHANDRIGEFESMGWKQANSLFINDGRGRFCQGGERENVGAGLRTGLPLTADTPLMFPIVSP